MKSITRLTLLSLITAACPPFPEGTTPIILSSSTGDSSSTTDPGVFSSTAEPDTTSSSETTGDDSTPSSGDASSTSSTSTGEASTSTGAMLPACRDGDPDAACWVFVTSAVTSPNLLAAGFDQLCQDLACNAGAPCGEYRALLRVDGDFWGPFAGFSGRYILTSGVTVAQGVNGLESALPITLDETGAEVPNKSSVWTGYSGTFMTCLAGQTPWGTTAANTYGDVGYVGGAGESKWSAEQATCDTQAHIYCVEVPAP